MALFILPNIIIRIFQKSALSEMIVFLRKVKKIRLRIITETDFGAIYQFLQTGNNEVLIDQIGNQLDTVFVACLLQKLGDMVTNRRNADE